ncbi:MAG: ferritin family protein [Candidatus Omnitrophica bacterium]|nr:ferritin family protein [Candidatus Omnitrophota bacterium]
MPHSQSADAILRLAIQVEEEGALFYRKLAGLARNPAVKETLLSLAEDELRHQKDLAQIANSFSSDGQAVSFPVNVIGMMKNSTETLKRMMKGAQPMDADVLTLGQAFNIAINNEKSAIRVYTDLANIFTPDLAVVLKKIIEEEKGHLDKLVRIKNFRLS